MNASVVSASRGATIASVADISGRSAPLGATPVPGGVNFSVFSKDAALVELLLFDDANAKQPSRVIPLEARRNRT